MRVATPDLSCAGGEGTAARQARVCQPSSAGQGGGAVPAQSPRPRPGILLDRDGTIIVDHGYVGTVERVEFIDGAADAIATFNAARIPVAVVTNQAGVARGRYGVDDVSLVHRYIAQRLAERDAHVDMYVYCPYHPDGTVEAFARSSDDRKPGPGMAKAAATALNLDLTASFVVGDRQEDIGLAEAVGATAIYLGGAALERPDVWSFASLAAAAPFILERIAA
jgi:D,D-heptose 1,7-bisphosphate phosphatase